MPTTSTSSPEPTAKKRTRAPSEYEIVQRLGENTAGLEWGPVKDAEPADTAEALAWLKEHGENGKKPPTAR